MSTLRTHNLTKSYGGRTVVRGVNLDVSSGEIVGLLGPNGAGKTTTFYMTVGLTPPDSGRVELDGHDVTDVPMYIRARKGIGVLITDHNVRETLRITDRAYIVHDGAIFKSGTPATLAADDEVRRIYLGTEFRLD